MARNEYGAEHHFISPLCASTTWNSWIRSRFWAWLSSMRSASPRVPTREKTRSKWPSAKSSQAAMNSRLSAARRSSSRRRQAGSTLRKVYLTKWRVGMPNPDDTHAKPSHSAGLGVTMAPMRIALVSPYSWTYPGGVTRHIEALAERFIADGHYVRVLAPFDPSDRLGAALHRGARPQPLDAPDYLPGLGRTLGFKAH